MKKLLLATVMCVGRWSPANARSSGPSSFWNPGLTGSTGGIGPGYRPIQAVARNIRFPEQAC
jgi:hypothetical protein